ncbi:unnamed protein product [Oppiella nova]|uniref:Uncharacterized protein n=1 Tax=Oppiella nova TaxID=334625 RepID=A0A7R9MBA6_9ACAR|nr:unnamed protein product [Oppiella nova]CAG2174150.1 unnamed protein product [Oppiella nova]
MSSSETSFQEIGRPLSGVGIVSTEGEKLLNALRKIQTKLHQKHHPMADKTLNSHHKLIPNKPTLATTSAYCANCAATDAMDGDHRGGGGDERHVLRSHTYACVHHKTCDENSGESLDARLKLIELQLKTISMQLGTSSGDEGTHVRLNASKIGGQPLATSNGHKRSTTGTAPTNGTNERLNGGSVGDNLDRHSGDDRFESSIHAIRDMMSGTTHAMPKSRSLDAINHKSWAAGAHYKPSKHFHLQYKDIPFLLGTTSNSHSVIASRQLEISRLKQHNQLCSHRNHNIPVRKIFDERIRQQVLDTEIKELLFDLHEEHDYICEEIQYLSKQLEQMGDESGRVTLDRELYFLSRRISAKKRQINELQEMHSLLRRNAVQSTSPSVDRTKQYGLILEAPVAQSIGYIITGAMRCNPDLNGPAIYYLKQRTSGIAL